MKTIIENQVQVNGASLQVELKSGNDLATPIVAALCPVATATATAPVYMTQLRGYSR